MPLQKCAFVDDINKCEKFPANWKKAEEIEFWGKVCPSLEYEWLEETLGCEAKIIDNEDFHNRNKTIEYNQQKSNIILIGVVGVVIIILLIILWFFFIERK